MPAVITDQFRILNASNFVDTVTGVGGASPTNSFYVTLGFRLSQGSNIEEEVSFYLERLR